VIFPNSEREIRIPVQQLRAPEDHTRTMIRFADTDRMIIGKQLLNSVERLVMNLDTGQVGIERKRSRIPALRSLVRFVPLFGRPELVFGENGGLSIQMARERGQGLILSSVSRNGRVIEFLKFPPEKADRLNVVVLSHRPLAFADCMRVGKAGVLSIPLQEPNQLDETGYRIVVSESSLRLLIVFEEPPLPRMADLDLPSPKDNMVSTPKRGEESECPICLTRFMRGDKLQSFRRCSHLFHRECLQNWLEEGHLNCPLCRCVVHYKV